MTTYSDYYGSRFFVTQKEVHMTNITKLAKHIKSRDNPAPYTPMFGKIISLPELKIRLGTRVLLTKSDIKSTFNIYETEIVDKRVK